MKLVAIALIGLGAAYAGASYDLMLIQAATPDPGTGLTRVHRVDPVSGASFGSFTIGIGRQAMAVSRELGELVCVDSTGVVRVFDYSTGERKATWGLGWTVSDVAFAADGRRLIMATTTSTNMVMVDIPTRAMWSYGNSFGTSPNVLSVSPTGQLFAATNSSRRLESFAPSGSSYGSISMVTWPSGFTQPMTSLAATGSTSTQSGKLWGVTGGALVYAQITFTETFGSGSLFGVAVAQHSAVSAVVRSHSGVYVLGPDSTDSTKVRVSELDSQGLLWGSTTFSGISGGAADVAIVLAPEPGTLAACALGLGALFARRRRR